MLAYVYDLASFVVLDSFDVEAEAEAEAEARGWNLYDVGITCNPAFGFSGGLVLDVVLDD